MTQAEPLKEAKRALREHGGERIIRYENELAGSLLSKLIRAGGRPTPALEIRQTRSYPCFQIQRAIARSLR